MDWNAITAICSAVSMMAFVASAVFIRAELKHLEKSRYIAITGELFNIWQSTEFMEAQLWLLHRLDSPSWEEFVRVHRADVGEAAFHRVGSFYDRLGTLVRHKLVDEEEVLSTLGPYAIAVWEKIAPLVREARRIENSVLFDDFEALLPACHECYVPSLGRGGEVHPFSLLQAADRITKEELQPLLQRDGAVTLLDIRKPEQISKEPEVLPGAVAMTAEEVERRHVELPRDREVVVYCA